MLFFSALRLKELQKAAIQYLTRTVII